MGIFFKSKMRYKKDKHKKMIYFCVLKVENKISWFLNLFFFIVN